MYFDDIEYSMERVCTTLVRESHAPSSSQNEMLALLLRQIVLLIERKEEERNLSAGEHAVRAAERLLEENLAQPFGIAQAARKIGVSPSYLRAQFSQRRDRTPRRHAQDIRLRKALSLLNQSSQTLECIAHACGYCSASHLSRHVKSETGRTPGEHRSLKGAKNP